MIREHGMRRRGWMRWAGAACVALLGVASPTHAVDKMTASKSTRVEGGAQYRFLVPVEIDQVPRSISKLEVECEVCQNVNKQGQYHKCSGQVVSGKTAIPLRDGETELKEVEVAIGEHLMVQTGPNQMGPATTDRKYFCYLLFDGSRNHTATLSVHPAAPGSQPVLQVPGKKRFGTIPD